MFIDEHFKPNLMEVILDFNQVIFQGAGRLVQQGQGEGHHVGGGEVHVSQCAWFKPNFSSLIRRKQF